MKYRYIFCAGALMTALLASCAEPAVQQDVPEKITDFVNEYTTYHSVVETEGRYYLFQPQKHSLYYVDKETMEASVVCAREGCGHDTEECYAYGDAGDITDVVRLWEDSLYIVGSRGESTCLMRVPEDGAERVPVYEFPVDRIENFTIADRQLVFCMEEAEQGGGEQTGVVCAAALDSEEYQVIYRCDKSEQIERLLSFDDGVMIVSYLSDKDREKANWYVPSAGYLDEDVLYDNHHICYYQDGKVYYYVTSDDGESVEFCIGNPDGSGQQQLFELETEGQTLRQSMNAQYAFVNDVSAGTFYVYGLDGGTAAEIAIKDADCYFWYGIDSEYLYFHYSTPRDPDGKIVRAAISDVVNGTFKTSVLLK